MLVDWIESRHDGELLFHSVSDDLTPNLSQSTTDGRREGGMLCDIRPQGGHSMLEKPKVVFKT